MKKNYGLEHLWHPQLKLIDGVWYLYVTADDGDTDNHKMYVLENRESDPMKGKFEMKARIRTDSEDNWAMHGHVFSHNGRLYMIWSGWEKRRVFVENQCIYIAEMDTPWSLAGERVMISRPEHEWELQWIQKDGSSATRYPVFVNENPVFFCNELTDKAYIYYSASAQWSSYSCVGELSADKDSDLLDSNSWKKSPKPVFSSDREKGIYGSSRPYFTTSADGSRHYMLYTVQVSETVNADKNLMMQPFTIENGHPEFRRPLGLDEKIPGVLM